MVAPPSRRREDESGNMGHANEEISMAVGQRESDRPFPFSFPFVGETLALDFVNTEVVVRGRRIDLLSSPEALETWWRNAAERYPAIVAAFPRLAAERSPSERPATLAAAKELRAALRGLVAALAERGDDDRLAESDLAIVNRVLAAGREAVTIGTGGRPRAIREPREEGADGQLLAIASSALDLLTAKEASRLHRCGNERCILFFYDTTKSGTRRWCSVGCMNRARSSRRYRERKRAAVADA